jgi:hypothetical protein
MSVFEVNSQIGPDGKLLVVLPPELANTLVHVTVEATNRSNGVPATAAPKTREEWRKFIEATAGSMPDFPDIERPGPDSYEKRDFA